VRGGKELIMLEALAGWCARRARLVVVLWLLVAAGLLVGSATGGTGTSDDVEVPGSDSAAAAALLGADTAADQTNSQLVARAQPGHAIDESAIRAAARAISAVPGIGTVPDPLPTGVSPDRTAARMTIPVEPGTTVDAALAQRVLDAAGPARDAGLDVAVGGALGRKLSALDSRTSEVIGVIAALAILTVAFRSAVAAALPVITAILVAAAGLAGLRLLTSVVSIPDVAPTLAAMIGLGVGADYTLFCVSRQRRLVRSGLSPEDATRRTAATSGTAIVFAGATVIIAISGLSLVGVDFVAWLGWSSALLVVGAMLSTMTLTPALLRLSGRKLAGRATIATTDPELDGSAWGRLAARMTRRPVATAVLSVLVLITLAAPTATLRLGQTDNGDRAASQQLRRYYDLVAAGWGPGENGPLTVVLPDRADAEQATIALGTVPGVAAVRNQRPVGASAVSLQVVPTTAPSDQATADLVHRLRSQVLPPFDGHLGGVTAIKIDLADRITARLPWLVLTVVGIACLLLLIAFRSLVLPLKAAAMNLISVAAAYGVVTAVFQWGWGSRLLGLEGPVPIDSYVPMVLFAVLFGLSMDYEVFLLSAIREHWQRNRDNTAATRRGMAETGGVITSAALIMVCVFASFVLAPDPTVKIFGLGLATAIIVDATIVRCLLVPATMTLLGRWNWWLPAPIDRVLPHFLEHRTAPAARIF
jgi:RND superfamily putative drug exporter